MKYAPALVVLAFLPGLPAVSTADGQTVDTLYRKSAWFDASDALLLGGFTAATAAAAPADRWFTRQLQDDARQANRTLNRGATIFRIFGLPGSLIAGGGLYAAGLIGSDRRVEDLGLHSMEAVFIGSIVTGTVKAVAGRARPRVSKDNARNFKLFRGIGRDDYQSFPSGHTTAAFAFASIVSAETSHWSAESRWIVGPLVYGAATLTGVSRIYNNAHWASDVLAGAAIGTFTGIKIYRYQHSHPGNWLDNKFLRAGISISNTGTMVPLISVTPR